jgi:hypothetical protein
MLATLELKFAEDPFDSWQEDLIGKWCASADDGKMNVEHGDSIHSNSKP